MFLLIRTGHAESAAQWREMGRTTAAAPMFASEVAQLEVTRGALLQGMTAAATRYGAAGATGQAGINVAELFMGALTPNLISRMPSAPRRLRDDELIEIGQMIDARGSA